MVVTPDTVGLSDGCLRYRLQHSFEFSVPDSKFFL